MIALLLTVAIFAGFWLIGIALLAAVRADTAALRVTLTAPALGSCVVLLPAFMLSHAGVPIGRVALPLVIALVLVAVVLLAIRRPPLPVTAVPVLGACALGLLLAARPMHEFGFHWLANGNADMANYTLSAQDLVHHGLLAPYDLTGLARGVDYATTLTALHLIGSRPGADLMLSLTSSATGRIPYEIFMSVVFALNLCGVCAAGALAMQASRRWWAATIAALLLAISPLATFGVLQQLIAQVWGLGLGAALFALLMRSNLHRRGASAISDGIPIAVLFVGLTLVYVELAAALAAAYALYLVVLAFRREFVLSVTLRLWLPAIAIAVIVLAGYLPTELRYVTSQAGVGSVNGGNEAPLFGYALVPAALPAILGLQELKPLITAPHLELSIAIAVILLICALVGAVISARRGVGAAVVLVTFAVLGGVLGLHSSDFGLFKLYMYVQPFLAALIAVWLTSGHKYVRWGVLLPVLALAVAQLSTQRAVVRESRDPVDLPHASAPDLLPEFRRIVAEAHGPVIAASEGSTLIELEGESAPGRPVFFPSTILFRLLLNSTIAGRAVENKDDTAKSAISDVTRPFNLHSSEFPKTDPFEENANVTKSLSSPGCKLVLPTGTEIPVNRRLLPEGSPALDAVPCADAHDLFSFTDSKLGAPFFLSQNRRVVSYYQLENDPYFPGHTFAGFGRYVLFRAYGPLPGARLELSITGTLRQDASNGVPRVSVVGARRAALPVVGRGSARVFSEPLDYQVINGARYLLLDAGEEGKRFGHGRSGLAGLYAGEVPLDPRRLTSYVRSISLISGREYAELQPPLSLTTFPADLANQNLEYSGIYEDGWVGEDAYAVLAGGPRANLVMQATVPAGAGKHLAVLLNGRTVASLAVAPGALHVSIPVPATSSRRRVELRFAATVPLEAPDRRPAAAQLSFIGFVPAG